MRLPFQPDGRRRLPPPRPEAFEARLAAANAALAEAPGGCVLLCGDSHAALLEPDAPAGIAVVNAAVSGIGLDDYAAFAGRLRFRRPARTALLSIGFNDMVADRRFRPPSPREFRAGVECILARLRPGAERVVFLAYPPVDPGRVSRDGPEALDAYSRRIRRLCAREPRRLAYADPFAGLRTARFGVARPGALADGIHIADHGEVWRRLAPWL